MKKKKHQLVLCNRQGSCLDITFAAVYDLNCAFHWCTYLQSCCWCLC